MTYSELLELLKKMGKNYLDKKVIIYVNSMNFSGVVVNIEENKENISMLDKDYPILFLDK